MPHHLPTDEANAMSKALNAMNAESISDSEHATAVVLAVVIGALLACLALHYWEPCADASLCVAIITPLRTGWLQRLRLRFSAWQLRLSLADHEATLQRVDSDLQALPIVRNNLQRNVDHCRTALADCEAALAQGRQP